MKLLMRMLMQLIATKSAIHKEIVELYEHEQNLELAIVYFEKAVDLFQSEEVSTSANQCKQKVAQYAAQLEQSHGVGVVLCSFDRHKRLTF
ncbi:hypothetical protein SASPL_135401 [Salvia splendens]|uniref:Uncharacterized protein n=1 Tax=Salvia splendens TaxID=180675 RepID=A0A8X8ZGL3_SALSN|nr:hypothetical protein SASPL_135401 [Salvia splendens]